jgi:hypothetical protein
MNQTVTANYAIQTEATSFHTQPLLVTPGRPRLPVLVAFWNRDVDGRLFQTWVSAAVAVGQDEADAYIPAP